MKPQTATMDRDSMYNSTDFQTNSAAAATKKAQITTAKRENPVKQELKTKGFTKLQNVSRGLKFPNQQTELAGCRT